jgi:hypothetical protein
MLHADRSELGHLLLSSLRWLAGQARAVFGQIWLESASSQTGKAEKGPRDCAANLSTFTLVLLFGNAAIARPKEPGGAVHLTGRITGKIRDTITAKDPVQCYC